MPKVLPESQTGTSTKMSYNGNPSSLRKKRKNRLKLDHRSGVAIGVALAMLCVIVGVEIASSDLNVRVEDRVVRNLLWKLGKTSRDYSFYTACANQSALTGSEADAGLEASLEDFHQAYVGAKRTLPSLKETSSDYKDFYDAYSDFMDEDSKGTTCDGGKYLTFEKALTTFRKSIGEVAKDVRTTSTAFDVVVSVLALLVGVFFVLLADGRGNGSKRAPMTKMEKSKHAAQEAAQKRAQEEGGGQSTAAAKAQDLENSAIHQLTTVAAVVANAKMQILDCNKAACALLGYEKSALVDQNVKVLMPTDVADVHDSYVSEYMKTKQESLIGDIRTLPVCRKDGSVINATVKLLKSGPDSNMQFVAFMKDNDAPVESDSALLSFQDATTLYEIMEGVQDQSLIVSDALAAQEEMLRNLSVPVIVADATMTILDINDAASKIFGYEHFELKGKNVKELMFDNLAAKHDGFIERHLRTGVNRIIGSNIGRKVEARHKDGSSLQLILNVGKSKSMTGDLQFVAIAQDVTSLMQKMEEIEKERQRTILLVDSQKQFLQDLAVGVVVADDKMIIKDVNSAAQRIFGYADSEFIGRNVKMLMHDGELKKNHDDIVNNYLKTGVAKIIGSFEGRQVTAKHANGSNIEIILNVNRSQTQDDPPRAQFTAVFQDVTALTKKMRQSERQSRMTERLVQSQADFLRDLAVGVVVADKNMIIKTVNRAAQRIFGFDEEQFIGQNVKMLMPDGDLKKNHDDIVAAYLKTGKAKIIGSFRGRQVTAKHASGTDLEIILNVSKSFGVNDCEDSGDESTPEPQFTAVFQDVTELSQKMKQVEKERERTLDLVSAQKDFLKDLAVGVIVADKAMTIKSINLAGQRVFGYEESDFIGQNVKMLMPRGDLRDKHDDIVNNYLRTGKAKIIGSFEGRQVTAKHKDGSELEIVLNVSRGYTQDEPPEPQFTAVFQDVTALAKTMKDMQKQKEETEDLVNSQKQFLQDLAVGVIQADKTMTIEDCNTAAIRIFGYSEQDLIGSNVKMLMVDGEIKDRHDDIIAEHLRTGKAKIIGQPDGRRVTGRTKDGREIALVINISRSTSKDGQPKFTAVFQDLTKVDTAT